VEELTEKEKKQFFSEEFYKEEKIWFPEYEKIITTEQAKLFFNLVIDKYNIPGWVINWSNNDDGGIAVCDYDNHKLIIGTNPTLCIFLHEIGHILTEEGHSEEHKNKMLELYSLWKSL
jgi:hypothetical protein